MDPISFRFHINIVCDKYYALKFHMDNVLKYGGTIKVLQSYNLMKEFNSNIRITVFERTKSKLKSINVYETQQYKDSICFSTLWKLNLIPTRKQLLRGEQKNLFSTKVYLNKLTIIHIYIREVAIVGKHQR